MSTMAELKTQGNALFIAKDFKQAAQKYTEAIAAGDEAADPKGMAVLYANRAACRTSLKRYMDAHSDAKTATRLDPTYAKGFARLATAEDAMGEYPESQISWQKALDALPKSDLKPAELVQKEQYQAALKLADAGVEKLKNTYTVGERPVIVRGDGRLPWELASAIVADLQQQLERRPPSTEEVTSSAWVIHGAHGEFMDGIKSMNSLVPHAAASGAYFGMLGGLAELTNGIMRDERILHFTDNDFISKYNKQVAFEAAATRAWVEGGPEVVIKEALVRQRKEGWNSVRPAISVTVRAWMMRAVMESGMRQKHDVAVELFKRSLEVLRSLRESWLLVSKDNRGAVFEKTFIFGVQRLYIEAIMQSFALNPDISVLKELYEESDLLIREVDEALRQPRGKEPVDPGFVSSFYVYPRAKAYAMKGFYYNRMPEKNPDQSQRKELYRQAGLAYIKAAECFPQDDEQHPWFLNCALGNMFASGSFPLRESLDVMKRIRISAPKAKQIWERSSLSASGLWKILEGVGRREEELRSMVLQGKFTLDQCVAAASD
ncbi:hypothetical protein C8J57DRAFT_292412 [Mycena rebaudengoi]|nr:hypothetical protein C8J57DRAFT_292412 [Mycena rebaudengoi]